jgi:hypothetical protein
MRLSNACSSVSPKPSSPVARFSLPVTGALAPNEYNKEVGEQQVPIKSLKVKVLSFELFGLKSDALFRTGTIWRA